MKTDECLFYKILSMGYEGTEAIELSNCIRKIGRPDLVYDILMAIGCKHKYRFEELTNEYGIKSMC